MTSTIGSNSPKILQWRGSHSRQGSSTTSVGPYALLPSMGQEVHEGNNGFSVEGICVPVETVGESYESNLHYVIDIPSRRSAFEIHCLKGTDFWICSKRGQTADLEYHKGDDKNSDVPMWKGKPIYQIKSLPSTRFSAPLQAFETIDVIY